MKQLLASLLILVTALPLLCAAETYEFTEIAPKTVRLTENGVPVWEYVYGQTDHPWGDPNDPRRFSGCYFHPIYGFGGESITLNASGWDGHSHHHALWTSFTTVDLLRNDTPIHYDSWTDNTPLKEDFIEWIDRKAVPEGWLMSVRNGCFIHGENGEKEELLEEQIDLLTRPVTTDPDAGKIRILDFTFKWKTIKEKVELAGDRQYKKDFSGMVIRFSYPALPPKIFSQELEYTEDCNIGSSVSPWIAYESDFAADGRALLAEHPDYVKLSRFPVIHESAGKPTSGTAIFRHPGNPQFNGGWAVRFYGLLTTGWPGLEGQILNPDETYTLKYRVLIYEKPLTPETLNRLYQDYAR